MRLSYAASLATAIEAELRRAGTPERAEGAKRYLKSELAFLGADTRSLRAAVRGALADAGPLSRSGVLALVRELWGRGIFELRAAAVEVLIMREQLLKRGDVSLVERLIRDSRTWALVDSLAVHVAGPLLVRSPELGEVLDRWAGDADFWVRRTALLALLVPLRRGGGDFARFARYADAMLEEREFFIRKAIGWVLRETSKKRPQLVFDWLAPRCHRASGVTVREAVRYLSDGERRRLLETHRKRRVRAPGRGGGV